MPNRQRPIFTRMQGKVIANQCDHVVQ